MTVLTQLYLIKSSADFHLDVGAHYGVSLGSSFSAAAEHLTSSHPEYKTTTFQSLCSVTRAALGLGVKTPA